MLAIAGLISGITFMVLFQSGEASTVEGNKDIHTHTETSQLIFNTGVEPETPLVKFYS